MLIEVISHAIMLDVGWFIPFIMNNLIWVFFLATLAYFIYEKNLLFGTAFVAIYLYATFDLANVFGWVFQKGFFWAPLMVFLVLTVYDAFFKNGLNFLKRPIFAGVMFYSALFFINVVI
tara:strand:+ start:16631 stop:16987 length:357 start_codon:yes stop_codon:yes gene_type:complete